MSTFSEMSKIQGPNSESFDFVVVGAGVVGLSIARELALKKLGKVKVVEKEIHPGLHASGRNSGVLHSGIYYPPGSLKSQLCVNGARMLREFLQTRGLPHVPSGKLILPPPDSAASELDKLKAQALENGVELRSLNRDEILEIEPEAYPAEAGLYSPGTWTFDPRSVIESLTQELASLGVQLSMSEKYLSFNADEQELRTSSATYSCGTLINAAGAWADSVAHAQGVGRNYRIFPFKGSYFQLSESFAQKIRGLIYGIPDPKLPFLGLHVTRGVYGRVFLGPTALPALGRENYKLVENLQLKDSWKLLKILGHFAIHNPDHLRNHIQKEILLLQKHYFIKEIRKLIPKVSAKHLLTSSKVGIRPQVVNTNDSSLCMDFIFERGKNSFHIINSISPAFSSSLAVARWVCETLQKKEDESA